MDTGEDGKPEQTNIETRGRRDSRAPKKGKIKTYIAGILTAVAPSWIYSALVLTAPIEDVVDLMILCFLVATVGGALGGYLSARHSFEQPLRMAVFSGIGSYTLLAIVDWFLRIDPIYDAAALIAFPIGFAVGARIIELQRIKKQKSNATK
jgi:hypothetical protein